MTYAEALRLWDKQESLWLLSFVTSCTPTEILLNDERELTESNRFKTLIDQRKNHVPLQYLIGSWEFMGLRFKTDSRALIPRPETELLAEAVIKAKPKNLLDLCTGSGCLAVALAKITGADVTAVDISPNALSLAKENAACHGVTDKIKFIACNLFDGIGNVTFDAIVSNPPYIPTGQMSGLQAEVRDYEPHLALDGGNDGLDFYRRIIPASLSYLSPDGVLFLEIGEWKGVTDLMRHAGFTVNTIDDYAGFKRVVYGSLSPSSVSSVRSFP